MTSERHLVGIYCLIFSLYWRIQLKKADRWRGVVFFYALTLNFILCTAYFIIAIMLVQFYITVSHIQAYTIVQMSWLPIWSSSSWFSNSQMGVLNEDSLESTVNWMVIANNALYTAIDFITQLILVSQVSLAYKPFSINILSISKWSFTDVGSCGADHWLWLSHAFYHLRF